jgi:hypothetical protein
LLQEDLQDLLLPKKSTPKSSPICRQPGCAKTAPWSVFLDFNKEEREYYKKIRIFPIMHPIVVKKEILERDPWVATSLFEAFKDCQRGYRDFMEQPHRLSFAFARSYLEGEGLLRSRSLLSGIARKPSRRADNDRVGPRARDARSPLTVDELFYRKHPENLRLPVGNKNWAYHPQPIFKRMRLSCKFKFR